jgi:hypothetical protein
MHNDTVHAAVLTGDCNVIQPFDMTLHSDSGLKGACLELEREDDVDEGCI